MPYYCVSDKLSSKATEMSDKELGAEIASVEAKTLCGVFCFPHIQKHLIRLVILCHRGQSCLNYLYWSGKNLKSPFQPRLYTPHLSCSKLAQSSLAGLDNRVIVLLTDVTFSSVKT